VQDIRRIAFVTQRFLELQVSAFILAVAAVLILLFGDRIEPARAFAMFISASAGAMALA
jgi:hypothetical protein